MASTNAQGNGKSSNNTNLIAVGVVAIIVIAAALVLYSNTATAAANRAMALQITDPPQVPAGTQSLVIAYSALQAHVSGGAGSGWIASNSSGSINLLAVQNLTQTIGSVSAPNGSVIDKVRFNITSANITLNGTAYPVTVPSKQVTATLTAGATVNGTAGVLMSLSPTVVTIFTANSTVFVLVPSVKAVVLPSGTNQSTVSVGYKHHLETYETEKLNAERPNITVTNASITVAGNLTHFSATVNNNANTSIFIKHINVFGNVSVALNATAISRYADGYEGRILGNLKNSTICTNVSGSVVQNLTVSPNLSIEAHDRPSNSNTGASVSANSSVDVHSGFNVSANTSVDTHSGSNDTSNTTASTNSSVDTHSGGEGGRGGETNQNASTKESEHIDTGIGVDVNSSACTAPGFSEMEHQISGRIANTSAQLGDTQEHFKMFSFLVTTNGTLMLPSSVEDFNDSGFAIQPGQSATLSFGGAVEVGGGNLILRPVAGQQYAVRVQGENDAHASVNVTAS